MKGELANLDATEQAELVRRKEVSPLELVDAAITRIEKVNPQLNAVITPLFDKARAQAQEGRGSSLPDGPFRGVPFLLKDLVCASGGDPLYDGMRLLRDARFVAPYDTYLAANFGPPDSSASAKPTLPSWGSMVQPSPRRSALRAIRGMRRDRPEAPAAVPPPRWRRVWWRSLTPTTAAARSAFRPANAAWSG
jgi:Amidase